jgi:hypothetical protein
VAVDVIADPKPAPRIVDPKASRRKLAVDVFCRAHGRTVRVRATNCHHLIGKGQRGDDVEANLIPLCGSGSHGCHGALHGNPYTDTTGKRWTARDVRLAIGLGIRPDEYAYLLCELGSETTAEFLATRYFVEVVMLHPIRFREVTR